MSNRSRSSIRTLLRVWILGLALSALLLSLLFLAKDTGDHVTQQMQLAHDLTQLYADDSISVEYGRSNMVYVADSLRRLNRLLKGEAARIRSLDGTIVESTRPSEIGTRPSPSEFDPKAIVVDVREHSSLEKLGTLEVLINKKALFIAAIKKAAIPTLLLFFLLSTISWLIIQTLQRRVIKPIDQIISPVPIPTGADANWPTEIHDLSCRLQEALSRRDLAVVGQMAGGIIHDLKTLLHSIWSAAQLAEEQPIGSEKRLLRLESFLRAANTNFPKMKAIIQTTLDGVSQIHIEPRPGSITDTIEQAIKSTESLASRSKVKLDLHPEDSTIQAHFDPTQLERALTNLIKNAVEAAGQGATVPAKVLVRALKLPEKGCHIVVEDSGSGLGPDPTQVLKSMRSTKVHGSGLGLLISRKIIEAHSGRLLAGKSETLGGARFDIVLPHQEEHA